ncbi:MAG: CHAT domain-containing protein [Saprospiraceae bacterium]
MAIKTQVQKLIAENKLEDALQVFHTWATSRNDTELENSLLVIQARLSRMKQQERLGIIQFSEALREQAFIANSILDFLQQVEDAPETTPGPGTPEVNDGRKVILFLASNPTQTAKLQLEKEFVRISTSLQNGVTEFKLVAEWAVTPGDLQIAILRHKPHIIHFSGHGVADKADLPDARGIVPALAKQGGIVLQGPGGEPRFVSGDALADMFRIMVQKFTIEIVILNACHQEEQARAIVQHIPYVIGTNDAIDDNAAIEFSTGFYRGISAEGGDVAFAFDLAKNNIMLEGLEDSQVPVIYRKGG